MIIRIILTISCFCILACQGSDEKSTGNGNTVLRDYVKTPMDKAKIADKLNDRHNRQIEQSIEELDQ